MSDFFRKHTLGLLISGLWLVTLIGIRSVPLETHEIFVLESARQMNATGDWILPRFNDNLRLNKPPLNYWATVLISRIDPFSNDVEIWHGRLISLMAGLLMATLTFRTGSKLYGKKTGLVATMLLMCSQGFIHLSHNARPDFLYGSLCALQLFSWVKAWQAADRTPAQRWSSLLGWMFAALATLTKGPQVPLVFLLGLLLFLMTGPDRKRTLLVVQPLSGTVLLCALVLPWWILLNQRLQTLGVNLRDSQLSGSLLYNLATWKELLSGFYLWTTVALMLPMSLLGIFLLPKLWKVRKKIQPVTRLLLTITTVWIIIFTLGGHYRKHYLLPLLPIFAIGLARALEIFAPAELPRRWRKLLWFLGISAAAGAVGLLCRLGAYGTLALLSIAMPALFWLLRQLLTTPLWNSPSFARWVLPIALCMTALLTVGHTFLPQVLPRLRHRLDEQAFATSISQELPTGALLLDWGSDLEMLPYYVKRTVPSVNSREQLNQLLTEHRLELPIFCVLPASEINWLESQFEFDILLRTPQRFIRVPDEVLVRIRNHREIPAGSLQKDNTLLSPEPGPSGLSTLLFPLEMFLLLDSI
jgi:hypothetical protein